MSQPYKNWHQKHADQMTLGDRVADRVASFIGSWKFVIGQAALLAVWAVVNTLYLFHVIWFDRFPFVFMNLFMSAEAAFSTPMIMMSQNRAASRDKVQAEHQYEHQEKELTANTKITREIHQLTQEIHQRVTTGETK